MKVDLLATSFLVNDDFCGTGFHLDDQAEEFEGWDFYDPDHIAEFAGRNCYQSFDKPNPKTRANKDYLSNILNQSHESVLEHANVTFFVSGVSRSLLAELSRHRHLSFSVESQRYVEPEFAWVTPPIIEDYPELAGIYGGVLEVVESAYKDIYDHLRDNQVSKKKAREAARSVLPNFTSVTMVVSGNIRAWRDVLKKRHHKAADAEIQVFAKKVLAHLRKIAPNSVQDIPEDAYV